MTTKADNPESPGFSEFAEGYQTVWKEMMEAGNRAVKSSETLSKLKRSDVQIAETPADVVFQVDKVTLSRYRPLTDKKANTPPIIICYGLFCFARAPGCSLAGEASAEFSWFAGYVWRIALCGLPPYLGGSLKRGNTDAKARRLHDHGPDPGRD